MNASTSEYSAACESGWTSYLDQLSSPEDQCNRSINPDTEPRRKGAYVNENEEEEEDSSMLSDASSGPPHFNQDEDSSEEARYNSTAFSASEKEMGKHRKKALKGQRSYNQQNENVHLDDTASSPVHSFSKNNAVPNKDISLLAAGSVLSQGFSATEFKSKSVLKEHFGFLKTSHERKS